MCNWKLDWNKNSLKGGICYSGWISDNAGECCSMIMCHYKMIQQQLSNIFRDPSFLSITKYSINVCLCQICDLHVPVRDIFVSLFFGHQSSCTSIGWDSQSINKSFLLSPGPPRSPCACSRWMASLVAHSNVLMSGEKAWMKEPMYTIAQAKWLQLPTKPPLWRC